ncbi:ferredoxin [Clostridium botulinum]|uniref:Ferredoxin n=1 Tax=Clostridium botulinum C/D str. DC5 TaxID=1443128 RepID=A0A0A0I8T4_CLOBO|nr:ferredoxin [Clostridium botulinum]KEI06748.1 ferredoxin [Clostridium botulinum C/D str. BKT75002]KEI10858.1 ferredoxin [Clostridium botulinum C/D str. BKT2873]KGM93511.1 ferredoxin [Clostridium botulinum D str. CCUG 7971]KGM97879.1 ferredoxin [Clostridium botulinum C/D str. DC5]KOC49222.1 ferredoxin [Clostridium botulinum]
MKAVINVSNIRSQKDVASITRALGSKEGIIACYIKKEIGKVDIVYDDYFINIDEIKELLEDKGYTII